MKRKKLGYLIFIAIFHLFFLTAVADSTGPPDPGGEPESGDPPLGGGAPIDGGVAIMVMMAAAYGGKKVYTMRNKKS